MDDELQPIPDQRTGGLPDRKKRAAWSPLWGGLASIVADANRRLAAPGEAASEAKHAAQPPEP